MANSQMIIADKILHNGTIWCGYEEGIVEAQIGRASCRERV